MLAPVPWLLIGLAARLPGIDAVVGYHALRLLSGAAYLLLVWGIARELYEDDYARVLTVVIVGVGAGLAFPVLLVNRLAGHELLTSAEHIPEHWFYHSVLVQAHFPLALAALALAALSVIRGWPECGWASASGRSSGWRCLPTCSRTRRRSSCPCSECRLS